MDSPANAALEAFARRRRRGRAGATSALEPATRDLERVARDRQRLKELRELEARLAGVERPASFYDDPKVVALARLELAAVREVIAAAPPDLEEQPVEPVRLSPEEEEARARESRVAELRAFIKSNRSVVAVTRHSLEAVEAKLRAPVDRRDYKPPRILPSMNPVEAEQLINRSWEQFVERARGSLHAKRDGILAELEELETELAQAEADLLGMGEAL